MDLKKIAIKVFLRTIESIEPYSIINRYVRIDRNKLLIGNVEISLDDYADVVVIGIGKASLSMGEAVETILGRRFTRGLLVTNHVGPTAVNSEVIVAGHPLPDANSIRAGKRIVELVKSCRPNSLILFLISGGGSSLVELPLSESITLEDLRLTNQVLLDCGAPIAEMNIVRKSLSQIKGGRLGKLAVNSRCIGLYISDVNPGDIKSIASNPLLPENLPNASEILSRFNLMEKLPPSVVSAIYASNRSVFFDGVEPNRAPLTALLLDNSHAIQTAAEYARQLGFLVEVNRDLIEGDYQSVANQLLARLLSLKKESSKEPVCIISGGEVSCVVHGEGVGGRNQEFVLYCAAQLASSGVIDDIVVLSCGTDGIDGNSAAAGAVAGSQLVTTANQHSADASSFIRANDSNSFFKKAGGLVVTGPSGNNVRDLRILMAQ
jgi:glycerate-2-kinase